MTYQSKLPEVFPHCVALREGHLAAYLAKLLEPNSRFPNGSSFSVTVDIEEGWRRLWLSEASFERVKELRL